MSNLDVSILLNSLNDEQRKAVITTEGFVRVVAGAGAGKTRVLVHRLGYLIQKLGVLPSSILSVTFTNKAAGEMKRRAQKMFGVNTSSRIQTFHGFCNTLLKEDIHYVFYPNTFIILDDEDQKQILKEIYEDLGLDSKSFTYKDALNKIHILKSNGLYVDKVTDPNINISIIITAEDNTETKIFKKYLLKQRKSFALDYDDLIMFALHVLTTFPDVLIKWQSRLQYIQVDEFQDVSSRQYNLVMILAGKHKNLFVVGDPDQTIYEWRGAKIEYFLNFPQYNDNRALNDETGTTKPIDTAQTIILNRNYRSNSGILKLSNALIRHNAIRMDKDLLATKTAKETKPIYYHAQTASQEGTWIAQQIDDLRNKAGIRFSDVAILFRALYVSRSIEEALIHSKIPYVVINGQEFYGRKEIKDALSFLRLIAFGDDISFSRIINEPPREIGKTRLEFIKTYAYENKVSFFDALKLNLNHKLFSRSSTVKKQGTLGYTPIYASTFVSIIESLRSRLSELTVSEILGEVLQQTGYEAYLLQSGDEERKSNLGELKVAINTYEKEASEFVPLSDYLADMALYSEKPEKKDSDHVSLMTVHSAKGLEFPYVFVCGLNEGIFPTSHAIDLRIMEEERRVAYVAFTRAEEQLFLTEASGFNFDNSFRMPSRFILDAGTDLFEVEGELPEEFWIKTEQSIAQKILKQAETKPMVSCPQFKIGDLVTHDLFGKGSVIGKASGVDAWDICFGDKMSKRTIASFALTLCPPPLAEEELPRPQEQDPPPIVTQSDPCVSETSEVSPRIAPELDTPIQVQAEKPRESLLHKIFVKLCIQNK